MSLPLAYEQCFLLCSVHNMHTCIVSPSSIYLSLRPHSPPLPPSSFILLRHLSLLPPLPGGAHEVQHQPTTGRQHPSSRLPGVCGGDDGGNCQPNDEHQVTRTHHHRAEDHCRVRVAKKMGGRGRGEGGWGRGGQGRGEGKGGRGDNDRGITCQCSYLTREMQHFRNRYY